MQSAEEDEEYDTDEEGWEASPLFEMPMARASSVTVRQDCKQERPMLDYLGSFSLKASIEDPDSYIRQVRRSLLCCWS